MDTPAWFENAVAVRPREGETRYRDASIRTLSWGDAGKPGLVLVHGGSAHAHWWDPLAPLLTDRFHVVAHDMSGHGDSDHRETYSPEIWAGEVCAVIEAVGLDRPCVVGHSMGGLVAAATHAYHRELIRGCVVVDSPVEPPRKRVDSNERFLGGIAPYDSLDEAVARFRLLPAQPCANRFFTDYIARASLRETAAGWVWKFDANLFRKLEIRDFGAIYAGLDERFALFRGEHSSLLPAGAGEILLSRTGRRVPLVTIPDAHHHLIVDQPLAFIAALGTLLALWDQ